MSYAHSANHKDSLKFFALQSDGGLFNPRKDIFRSIHMQFEFFFTVCDMDDNFERVGFYDCMQGILFVFLRVLDNFGWLQFQLFYFKHNIQRSKRVFKRCACFLL